MLDFNVAAQPQPKPEKKKPAPAAAPPPAAWDPFDVAPVRDALKVYEAECNRMKQIAQDHQVVDEESNRSAIEMAAQAKRLGKTVEDLRLEKVRPYQAYTKAIGNLAKIYTDTADMIERTLKGKINSYLAAERMKKAEAERRAQEEARKLQAQLDQEAKEKGLPQVEVPLPVLPQKMDPVRTEEGSASQRKDWKWQVVSPDEIPREYLALDSVAVNKAVRAGVRSIPGIKIYQEESVQIRL
jgi:hypothetical protein